MIIWTNVLHGCILACFYFNTPRCFPVTMMPWKAFELLFFAIFGQTDTASLQVHKIKPEQIRCPVIPTVPLLSTTAVAPLGSAKEVTTNLTTTTTPAPIFEPGQPEWTEKMFVVAFGIYQIVAVIVLINLLIAMMSDTYQRIQVCISPLTHKCLFIRLTSISLTLVRFKTFYAFPTISLFFYLWEYCSLFFICLFHNCF